jgi:hypothetical protein
MNAFVGWTFDARTVAPSVGGPDPVPDNWYKVVVDKSTIKPTRDAANNMLELQLKIIEGQFNGRTVYWNLNLFHTTSQAAVEMAYKALSAISHVTGQFQLAAQPGEGVALPMIHNIPFYVHVIVRQGDRGPVNDIRGIKDVMGNEPGKQAQGGGPAAPAPAAPPPGPSWGPPAGGPAIPSTLSAPGGWQPGGQPQGQPPAAPPAQPGGWTTQPPGQPPAQPAGAPQQSWGPPAGQPQPQQPGPAPTGAPAWQPPGGQPLPPGAPSALQPSGPQWQQPGGAPQQQWAGPGGAGGPPQGAPGWQR